MKINYPALYAIAVGLFLAFDGVWLGLIAKKLYATELKGLMTNNVKWGRLKMINDIFNSNINNVNNISIPNLKINLNL